MTFPQSHPGDTVQTIDSNTLDLCDLVDLLAETTLPLLGELPGVARQRIDARIRQLNEQATRVRHNLRLNDRVNDGETVFPRLAV